MNYSALQINIFNAVADRQRNIIVNAKAGSGKTTTAVAATKHMVGSKLFLAFNKSIANVMTGKLAAAGAEADARTISSLGYGAVAQGIKPVRINMNDDKYRNLIKGQFEDRKAANDFIRLFDLCRSTLTDMNNPEAVQDTMDHYGLEVDSEIALNMIQLLPIIARQGIDLARKNGVIDFTDMIWLPVTQGWAPKKYDNIVIDEAQDLSRCMRTLVLMARKPNTLVLAIGDPNQSIYGFTGADTESFQVLKETLNAIELPLSVSYRCPKAVIELAQGIVPEIEAAPNAEEGFVEVNLPYNKLASTLKVNDLVLCRINAPLIKLCISLISQSISARVRGRDLAAALSSIVRKVAKSNGGVFTLAALDEWSMREEEIITAKPHYESKLQAHQDKIAGVEACARAFGNDVFDLCQGIDSLFEEGKPAITLSSVHRAKGDEADNVFILKPELLPMFREQQTEWEAQQEINLEYVAYTRAIKTLSFVYGDEK